MKKINEQPIPIETGYELRQSRVQQSIFEKYLNESELFPATTKAMLKIAIENLSSSTEISKETILKNLKIIENNLATIAKIKNYFIVYKQINSKISTDRKKRDELNEAFQEIEGVLGHTLPIKQLLKKDVHTTDNTDDLESKQLQKEIDFIFGKISSFLNIFNDPQNKLYHKLKAIHQNSDQKKSFILLKSLYIIFTNIFETKEKIEATSDDQQIIILKKQQRKQFEVFANFLSAYGK